MILTTEQIELLFKCIGGGPIDRASIVMFANELGTAEAPTTKEAIEKFQRDWTSNPVYPVGEGFFTTTIGSLPVNSIFLQFVARMALAVYHKDERFFGTLSGPGKAVLNSYIMNELYRTDVAVINLRPLPRSTEKHWDYENIEEKGYLNLFNFTSRRSHESSWKNLRLSAMKNAFDLCKNSLILGSGDKHNKKAFLETIYDGIKFEYITLNNGTQVYVSKSPKIILSNYYSSYNGLGLSGLKEIYNYITKNNMI